MGNKLELTWLGKEDEIKKSSYKEVPYDVRKSV